MKTSHGVIATAAIAGLALLGFTAPASAADVAGSGTFYTVADIGQEGGGSYPAGADWFTAELSSPWTDGTIASGATGLHIDATGPNQVVQLLRRNTTPVTVDTAFLAAIHSTEVCASSGDWTFQVAVYAEPGGLGYTTLRPAATGTNAAGSWVTSRAIIDGSGDILVPPGETRTLANLITQLFVDGAPEFLAYGIWVQGAELDLYGVDGFGHSDFFTPVPSVTISPDPATPAQMVSGITVTGSGWFPNSLIFMDLYNCDTQSSIYFDASQTADADGTFELTISTSTPPAEGTYCADINDDDVLYLASAMPEDLMFTIAEAAGPGGGGDDDGDDTDEVGDGDDAPSTTGELAETGIGDATPWLAGAGALLLLGAGAVALGSRRRLEH